MNFWVNIRKYFGERVLRKTKPGNRGISEIISFEHARNIGVLYCITPKDGHDNMMELLPSMFPLAEKISFLCWNKSKREVPVGSGMVSVCSFNVKDIKWNMIPDNEQVRKFIAEPFDLLIVPDDPSLFPVRYITVMSKAKCKAGTLRNQKAPIFDFMLDQAEENDFYKFCVQMQTMLEMFYRNNIK